MRKPASFLTFLAAAVFAPAWIAIGASLAQADDWASIRSAAKGQTVYWNAWGGGDTTNAYIAWVADRVEDEHGVDLVHVKLNDTVEAVRKVLAEKSAGRDQGGSVDLIWINGENFKAMKDADLLYGPLDSVLPNFALIDPEEKPTTRIDFTVPTDGLEAPWGMAKLVFIHDSAKLPTPPGSIREILDHAKANPGRVTYPAPPDFTGTTFLKQALYEMVIDPSVLLHPAGNNFEGVTAPLWALLDELDPVLWRNGRDYPKNKTALRQLLDDDEVDIAITFDVGEASAAINNGLLPETARTFVLRDGTIGNTHFVAIPYNAANKEGAMVVANFLMSPEAQAKKQHPDIWGDQTVLTMSRLDAAGRALFEALPKGVATLGPAELGPSLPEPHPSWMVMIEARWLERYGS